MLVIVKAGHSWQARHTNDGPEPPVPPTWVGGQRHSWLDVALDARCRDDELGGQGRLKGAQRGARGVHHAHGQPAGGGWGWGGGGGARGQRAEGR